MIYLHVHPTIQLLHPDSILYLETNLSSKFLRTISLLNTQLHLLHPGITRLTSGDHSAPSSRYRWLKSSIIDNEGPRVDDPAQRLTLSTSENPNHYS
jgi:hypothetical protein